MNLEDILELPTTGENAYTDEEMTWLYQTAQFNASKMAAEQKLPERGESHQFYDCQEHFMDPPGKARWVKSPNRFLMH